MATFKRRVSSLAIKKAISSLGRDYTMEEIGDKLGYSKSSVSNYLSNVSASTAFINKFEKVFNINLEDFESSDDIIELSDRLDNKSRIITSDNELLKELISELKERIKDLQKTVSEERSTKIYFKEKYDNLKKKEE